MLRERAAGGFASVCSGEITINDTDAARGFEDVDFPDESGEFFPMAQKAARIIKENGAVAMMELSHLGSIVSQSERFYNYNQSNFIFSIR